MSSDNFITIFKENGKFRAYEGSASAEETGKSLKEGHCMFEVDTLEEAIKKVQSVDHIVEYGYNVVGL